MSLAIKNSRELINPKNFKWKVLVCAPPGFGKTPWAAGSPNPIIAACENGEGKGLLTVAEMGLPYVEPANSKELESFCGGTLFKDYDSLVIDSGSDMCRTFIKDAALAIPRTRGNSEKRQQGVPELDDYGVMGEIFRRQIAKLLMVDKHIVVTAKVRMKTPDAETGKGDYTVGPDLPGEMMFNAPGMFDCCLIGKTRQRLIDQGGKKVRVTENYWITRPDGMHLAKCRSMRAGNIPLLAAEEPINLETGEGTWPYLFNKIVSEYATIYETVKGGTNGNSN